MTPLETAETRRDADKSVALHDMLRVGTHPRTSVFRTMCTPKRKADYTALYLTVPLAELVPDDDVKALKLPAPALLVCVSFERC